MFGIIKGGGVFLSNCLRDLDLCIPATFAKPRAPVKEQKIPLIRTLLTKGFAFGVYYRNPTKLPSGGKGVQTALYTVRRESRTLSDAAKQRRVFWLREEITPRKYFQLY